MSVLLLLLYFSVMALLFKALKLSHHFLLMLLNLEFLGMTLVGMIQFMLFHSLIFSNFMLIMFSMMVCEASVGLSVLINFTRQAGSDLMKVYFN